MGAKKRMRKMRMSMGALCAVLVVTITLTTSFGFVATFVRDGSTVSASGLLLLGPNTSSNTSALLVATKGQGLKAAASSFYLV
ncbi:hypothetical protein KSP40_PGU016930 [Platanthera guangdongensis]|uniref:Uncharacterized protein n=1 Tax=Platanthera guangdongensis TaxID=2320717 RepID=A0ABR2LRI8_9ASPA